MPEDAQGAAADSPPPDAGAAPSAAVASDQQVSGQAPPSPSQPEGQKPWNQPPEERWNEVLRQRDEARAQAEAFRQAFQQQVQRVQPVSSPPPDLLEGLVNHPDPATAQFWQQVSRVSEVIADRKAQERLVPLQQTLDLGRQQLAQVTVAQFRRENPDIAPNSPEEQAIVLRMNQGYPLEEAKRIVMYDVLQQKVSQQVGSQLKKQAEQKRQAAPEATAGMPATAGGVQAKGSYRETMDAELRSAGF